MIKTRKWDLPVEYSKLEPHEKRAVREQYIREQENLCQYCEMPLNETPSHKVMLAEISWELFPRNFHMHKIHLHHDHNNDLTIGAVHMRCNAYLWQYKGE